MYIIRFRSKGCTGWDVIESYGSKVQANQIAGMLRACGLYEVSEPVAAIIVK
jgi:hypothetical protein